MVALHQFRNLIGQLSSTYGGLKSGGISGHLYKRRRIAEFLIKGLALLLKLAKIRDLNRRIAQLVRALP